MATNDSVLLKWSNIIAFVLTLLVNGLAGSTTEAKFQKRQNAVNENCQFEKEVEAA